MALEVVVVVVTMALVVVIVMGLVVEIVMALVLAVIVMDLVGAMDSVVVMVWGKRVSKWLYLMGFKVSRD